MSTNSLGDMASLSSGPESDSPESLTVVNEGYDYIFVPKFGPGYECPICLSILREPRQTKCGHRFCRDCIFRWMSESSNRCPVDNEFLAEADIFPDNCIKREILSCPIKCPNHGEGCTELTTIMQMQRHLEQCQLSLLPCPNNCPCVIPRRDIDDHLIHKCENRMVSCQSCHEDMPACALETHKIKCPKEIVQCSHCSAAIFREELDNHVESECKNVVVHCPFHALGCNESVLREIEGIHLSAEIPSHLKMIATSYTSLLESFSSLAVGLRQIDKQMGTTQSEDDSQSSVTECAVSSVDRLGNSYSEIINQRQRNQISATNSNQQHHHHNHRHSDHFNGEQFPSHDGGGDGIDQRSASQSGLSLSTQGDDSTFPVENHHSYHSMPPSSGVSHDSKEIAASSDRNTNSNIPLPKLPLSGSQSVPILYQRSIPVSEASNSTDQAFSTDVSHPILSDFANSLRDLCTHQQQIIQKQQVIVTNLCSKLAATETRLKQLDGDGIMSLAQNMSGDFYWSINDFSVHREKAMREETSILHSPPFFSSQWGYKLCLRVNINGSLNSQGEHFVSLFIHFMQGSNDHLLNWPFVGQIVLSIIDQNPVCKDRRPATETLKARPEIAAFQKPTSVRNHKGFGYTDFISLNVLDNGNFVRDDTLIIRAQVFSPP